ncbi:hypothetical protein EYR38_007392 [Pleurotus pulmonarius]|nr:hypothetical protein EYR38_007392 [Pleurotus pulmonarius]
MADAQPSTSSGVRRSTRSRTSRVAIAQKPKRSEPAADVESSELSELSEEEASDFEEPAHRAKRAKVVMEVTPKKRVTSARRKKNLSLLPTVPFDVLMEVLARLRVTDIIALSRTSKEFRGLLLSKRSISVWKAALNAEGCLECPADLSEPAYAVLLFGGTNCYVRISARKTRPPPSYFSQNCGTKGIQRIDFGLRRRLCVRCMKSKLVYEKRFDTLFRGSDPMLLELIPYTHIGGHSHGHSSSGRFFYRDDIVKTQNAVKALEHAGDAKATNEFFKAQRDKTWAVISTIRQYETWVESAADRKVVESKSRAAQRWEDIQQRFRDLGYIDEDIKAIEFHASVKSDTLLTNQGWGRVRPALQVLVLEAKKARITKSRVALLSDTYTKYMRTLHPTQWAALPRIKELREFPEVQTLMQRDLDSDVSADEFADLVNDNVTIQKWVEGRQRLLESVIESGLSSTDSNNALVSANSSSPALPSTSVAHVFVCTVPDCRRTHARWGTGQQMFISLPAALNHRCESTAWLSPGSVNPVGFKFAYSARAAAAVKYILSLLKLSPTTTTTTDLDKLKNLFVCCKCSPRVRIKDGKPLSSFDVYTWREAVLHYYKDCIADLRSDIIDPQFTRTSLLDPNLQGDDSAPTYRKLWSCLHCAVHLHSWVDRNEVIAHVKSAHPITNPAEYVDFFANPLAGERPASQRQLCIPEGTDPPPALKHLVVAVTPAAAPAARPDTKQMYRCKLCNSSSTRRFILDGVRSHISAVHKIPQNAQRRNEHFQQA